MKETISHYKFVRKLGSGGMGDVFLAEDLNLHRRVALKLLPPDFAKDERRKERFLQEAHAASVLSHPNVCVIHEVGETEEGVPFISMEFVEGETLDRRIGGRPLDPMAIADVGMEVADALAEAHGKGIVHRDIKSANIMLTTRGHAKVLDFGLAKLTALPDPTNDDAETAMRLKTDPGVVIGTVFYMSPEQALGKEVDHRSDIFSLGTVLYEMATGRLPFKGDSTTQTIQRITAAQPEAIARFNYDVPADLERIIRKCLEKDREDRYQSAHELYVDLKRFKRDSSSGERSAEQARPAGKRSLAILWMSIAVACALVVTAGWFLYRRFASRPAIDSLAVLPFANTSRDPDVEYLSDGITESIINTLSQISTLRVIPRSTVFRYKGRDMDPQKIGAELHVRAVLTGRLLQRGSNVTVETELIDVANDRQIWGEQYDRPISDLATLQKQISKEMSEKLRLRLSGEEQSRIAKSPTVDSEAYKSYLKGRYAWNKRTGDSVKAAIAYFQQAIDKDPHYALAYAGLADSFLILEQYAGTPGSESLPKARAAAMRALEIDDHLAEAHTSLAFILTNMWQWQEAEKEFKRSIELNPNYPTTYHWYRHYLVTVGRPEEAMKAIRRAQELDPLSPIIALNVAGQYWMAGNRERGVGDLQKILELNPNFPAAHQWLGTFEVLTGRSAEGIDEARRAVELAGRSSETLANLAYCYAVSGRPSEAQQIVKDLEEEYSRRKTPAVYIAFAYAGLGDRDRVFTWLDKAYQSRSGLFTMTAVWPQFDSLKNDPRYHELRRRLGLTP